MKKITDALNKMLESILYMNFYFFLGIAFIFAGLLHITETSGLLLMGAGNIMFGLDGVLSYLRELVDHKDRMHLREIEMNHEKNMESLSKIEKSLDNIKFEIEKDEQAN